MAINYSALAASVKSRYVMNLTEDLPTTDVVANTGKYYAQYSTNNPSFVKISEVLRNNGVANHQFMLATFDKELLGVNPRDDNLPYHLTERVLQECVRNPWYYIREVVNVPVPGGEVPFELHLGNLFLIWCMLANLNVMLLLPRQNYKTVTACVVYAWMFTLGTRNSHILFFNKALGDSKNNLKRVKEIVEYLPEYMHNAMYSSGDRINSEFMESAELKNRIDAKPPGTSIDHADNLGYKIGSV